MLDQGQWHQSLLLVLQDTEEPPSNVPANQAERPALRPTARCSDTPSPGSDEEEGTSGDEDEDDTTSGSEGENDAASGNEEEEDTASSGDKKKNDSCWFRGIRVIPARREVSEPVQVRQSHQFLHVRHALPSLPLGQDAVALGRQRRLEVSGAPRSSRWTAASGWPVWPSLSGKSRIAVFRCWISICDAVRRLGHQKRTEMTDR